ncbi:MAG: hypothetical protein JWQ87_187, partial [Candidatus Sulfotelmatobacter sp.]|nr:hypothetical protein [Candidatus Sulfotelmatobacter sp.]
QQFQWQLRAVPDHSKRIHNNGDTWNIDRSVSTVTTQCRSDRTQLTYEPRSILLGYGAGVDQTSALDFVNYAWASKGHLQLF